MRDDSLQAADDHAQHVTSVIRAVVFDLDGVLLDSERVWDEARPRR
jgi:hypothetical protein